MDFEFAAQRLKKDQKSIRGRNRGPIVVSEQARKQAELQRQQRMKLQQQREQTKRIQDFQYQQLRKCERTLHLKSLLGVNPGGEIPTLSSASTMTTTTTTTTRTTHLSLQPTSIYGTGDKLSLPQSVLETLTARITYDGDDDHGTGGLGNPWTFRIGIVNPEYHFPASPLIQAITPLSTSTSSSASLPNVETNDGDTIMADSDEEDGDDDQQLFAWYLDELNHKYIAYTHCSVVEFTQEEGHVGIPQHIASALLDPKNRSPSFINNPIPTTRTVDPAKSSSSSDEGINDSTTTTDDEDPSMATPGHVAYGAFDVPNVPLEIVMVKLPKGTGCTVVPTEEAVRRGFYHLKDVKLVLEQSLIRTRATLSKGDIVSTWHRGVQYDLNVTTVLPSDFGAVTCINTDIVVDIGETKLEDEPVKEPSNPVPPMAPTSVGRTLGGGSVLGSSMTPSSSSCMNPPTVPLSSTGPSAPPSIELRPEPPQDQKDHVVNVQIRSSGGGNGKRRFDIHHATLKDLFDFATTTMLQFPNNDTSAFRLVTRFPRRVYSLNDEGDDNDNNNRSLSSQSLAEAGIQAGQELFMVEMIV